MEQCKNNDYNHKEKIFIYDFDLTLTTIHSNGQPINSYKGYKFINEHQEKRIIDAFDKIKNNNNNKIIILSRGLEEQIIEYLNIYHPKILMRINEIIGAKNIDEIIFDSNGTILWAEKKTKILEEIMEKENIVKNNIYFFDDTYMNIQKALENNFNAFFVKDPNRVFDNLDLYL